MSTKQASNSDIGAIANQLVKSYAETPGSLKILDLFLLATLVMGCVQFAYCMMVGTFPFNSFLAGFLACVGVFVLTGKRCAILDLV